MWHRAPNRWDRPVAIFEAAPLGAGQLVWFTIHLHVLAKGSSVPTLGIGLEARRMGCKTFVLHAWFPGPGRHPSLINESKGVPPSSVLPRRTSSMALCSVTLRFLNRSPAPERGSGAFRAPYCPLEAASLTPNPTSTPPVSRSSARVSAGRRSSLPSGIVAAIRMANQARVSSTCRPARKNE